jgi:hypothetical protein
MPGGGAFMLNTIRESWGWTGLDAAEVVVTNDFGNVIVRAADGALWRICPEELSCKVIARDEAEYEAITASKDFRLDWEMARLVAVACARVRRRHRETDRRCSGWRVREIEANEITIPLAAASPTKPIPSLKRTLLFDQPRDFLAVLVAATA